MNENYEFYCHAIKSAREWISIKQHRNEWYEQHWIFGSHSKHHLEHLSCRFLNFSFKPNNYPEVEIDGAPNRYNNTSPLPNTARILAFRHNDTHHRYKFERCYHSLKISYSFSVIYALAPFKRTFFTGNWLAGLYHYPNGWFPFKWNEPELSLNKTHLLLLTAYNRISGRVREEPIEKWSHYSGLILHLKWAILKHEQVFFTCAISNATFVTNDIV